MNSKIRRILAIVFFALITLLFLDFTGTIHTWFGWMAKIQFLPALLALNVGVVVGLVVLTLLMGRIYCSVICPLGVFQDAVSWIAGKTRKNRFSYSRPMTWLRYAMLALLVVSLVAGIGSIAALLAPYSAYGRMVSNLLSPLYLWSNNLLAHWAEQADSYSFYSAEVWIKGGVTLAVALITLVVLVVLAWKNGRTYCNTVCPVGTVLGFLSRFSWLKPVIDTEKCNSCGLCARNCKASCIDSKAHTIDYSRCVVCLDCVDKCKKEAIRYVPRRKNAVPQGDEKVDNGRRAFMTATALATAAGVAKAQEKKLDGGLATIIDKQKPLRETPIVPAGAMSLRHFTLHCTACQLCVQACPNQVLRPSSDMRRLMKPEASYERGYCRPECTKCSEVCPAGAFHLIDRAEKSSIQVGHAVWVEDNCVVNTDGVSCGNCARHCPTGAIQMIPKDPNDDKSPKIPAINTERCIGCGACEHLCPSRPFSAIYVEGHEVHRVI
ncbi:MAG: 4Fe-4S binding protein [Bacteroides sp.]|nr:4Fe-4S binding protein [Bacteroides sp.]